MSSLFLASLLHVLDRLSLDMIGDALDAPLRVMAGSLLKKDLLQHSEITWPWQEMALIKIDKERYLTHYHGQSPLDRVQLHDDLKLLLDHQPPLSLVAVDFDLSPTFPEIQRRQTTQQSANWACDSNLDKLVIANAKRVVLITPIGVDQRNPDAGVAEQQENAALKAWLACMTAQGVAFGYSDLSSRFGIVNYHEAQARDAADFGLPAAHEGIFEFAVAAALQRCKSPDIGLAESTAIARYCAVVDRLTARGANPPRSQISLHHRAWVQDASQSKSGSWTAPLQERNIRSVFFGAGYSDDDEFFTGVGSLNGVDIHAVIAGAPAESATHLAPFLLDIGIGVMFAYGIHYFWGRYFRQALRTTAATGRHPHRFTQDPQAAYVWLVALAFSVAFAMALLVCASLWLFAVLGVWISPAAMGVGIALESFVIGGVHAALHTLHGQQHGRSHQDSAPHKAVEPTVPVVLTHTKPARGHQSAPRGPLRQAVFHLPSLVWLGVVLSGLFFISSAALHH